MKTKPDTTRIDEIVAEMSSITEFALGSVISSSSYYTTRDGKRHRTKPQFKFQGRGGRGRQKLDALEAEYGRFVTEESLDVLGKTAGEGWSSRARASSAS